MASNKKETNPVPSYANLDAEIQRAVSDLLNIGYRIEADALSQEWKRARNYIDNQMSDLDLYETEFCGMYPAIIIAATLLKKGT